MPHDHRNFGKGTRQLGELEGLGGDWCARVSIERDATLTASDHERVHDRIAEDKPLQVAVELQTTKPRVEAALELLHRLLLKLRVDRCKTGNPIRMGLHRAEHVVVSRSILDRDELVHAAKDRAVDPRDIHLPQELVRGDTFANTLSDVTMAVDNGHDARAVKPT